MTRRELREEIFKIIFQTDFHSKEELVAQATLFLEDAGYSTKDREEILEKCKILYQLMFPYARKK